MVRHVSTLNFNQLGTIALVLVLTSTALVAPYTLSDFWITVAIFALYHAYLASAWNVIAGFAGQLSFGNALFVTIGAYTSTLLFVHYGISPWLGMWLGALLGMAAGIATGLIFFRLRVSAMGFALGTFALAQIAFWYITGSSALHRTDGYRLPLSFDFLDFQFRERELYYYVILALLAACLFVTWRLRAGRIGSYFVAIREDETAAQALGVDLLKYKTIALALSAGLSAIAGTFLAQLLLFVAPGPFLSRESILQPVIFTLFGGIGTVFGPAVGALVLIPIGEWLRSELGATLPGIHLVLYGTVLMVVIAILPNGVLGAFSDFRDRYSERQRTKARRRHRAELEK